jgi:hypothetical protein
LEKYHRTALFRVPPYYVLTVDLKSKLLRHVPMLLKGKIRMYVEKLVFAGATGVGWGIISSLAT